MCPSLRPLPVVLVLSLAACGDDNAGPIPSAPSGYPYAYSTNACGPTDGPGTRIILSRDPLTELPVVSPQVQVSVWQGAAELQGRTFTWAGSSPAGWAGRCDASGVCEAAASSTITFRENSADTVLSGTLRLRFQDGSTVSGGFDATWRRTEQVCG